MTVTTKTKEKYVYKLINICKTMGQCHNNTSYYCKNVRAKDNTTKFQDQ